MQQKTDTVDVTVREAIYSCTVATGHAPSANEVAVACHLDVASVEGAFRRLAESHIVVLKPGTTQLWSAPPFSAVPTSFRVHTSGVSWYAPCAWDMFGVPAAVRCDAVLEARCAWSGDPLPSIVKHGAVSGEGVVHLEVPARHFWDDIFYT